MAFCRVDMVIASFVLPKIVRVGDYTMGKLEIFIYSIISPLRLRVYNIS